ncbi:MAG: hypothetical protein AAF928_13760, partial [Myxococcota bacterium]
MVKQSVGYRFGVAVGVLVAAVGSGCGDDAPPSETSSGTGTGGGQSHQGGGTTADVRCGPAWPVEATIPRGEVPEALTWITDCEALAPEDIPRLTVGGDETFSITPLTLEGDERVFLGLRGTGVFAAGDATGPVLPDRDLTLGLDGAEFTVTLRGARTHLAGDDRTARYAAKASASTTQVPPHRPSAAPSPLGFGVASSVANGALMGATLGLAPTFLSTSWDPAATQLVLHSTPLGGAPADELGRIGAPPSETATLTGATTGDNGARLFITTLCTEDPSCPTALAFHQAIFDDVGQFAQLGGSGSDAVLTARPLDLALPFARGVHQSPLRGAGGIEFRTLYPSRDGTTSQWSVVDAFAEDMDGITTVEAVNDLFSVGGVTPTMVADGKARVGLVRAAAADLDPTVAPFEGELWAWTARPNPGGAGTTFALASLDGPEAGLPFQEKTFDALQPGTASLHLVPWGTGQARVYAGLDRDDDFVAFVGVVDAVTGAVGPTRPVNIPGVYRLSDAQSARLELRVWGNDDGDQFAVAVGMDPSNPDADEVGGALAAARRQIMVFAAGGPTATAEPLEGRAVPRLLEEGTGSDDGVTTPGGHATTAPIDPAVSALDPTTCDPTGVCATDVAALPGGLRVSYDPDPASGRSYYLHLTPAGTGAPLFEASPTQTILQNEPPVLIDLGEGNAEVIFSTLIEVNGDEGAGLLRRAISDGSVGPEETIAVDYGGIILRMLGGNDTGYAIHGVGATPQLLAVSVAGGSAPLATIDDGLPDATGAFSGDRRCPMADPSCAITASPALDTTSSERLSLSGRTVSRRPAEGLDGAEPFPSLLRIAALGDGACPLQMVLHPSFGGAVPPVVLSTSSREDCADLAVPVAAGDFLGRGHEQFLVMTADPAAGPSSTLSLVWVEHGADLPVVEVALGTVEVALDLTFQAAAAAVVAADVNEDGTPDLWFDPADRGVRVAPGARGFYLGDGRAGLLESAASIPGLDAMGPRGP